MKFNTQWQLPLLVVLLMTVNACKNKGKVAANEVALLQVTEEKATAASAKVTTDANTQFKYTGTPGYVATDSAGQQEEEQAPPAGNEKKQAPSPRQTPVANPDWDKKIIKNATLSVEVKDYVRFNELVRAAVKQSGGYIAQEEQSESDYKIENSITIKVPVDQFDNTVSALTPGKEKVLVRKITSQDVTGEVVDTRARLEAKRQVRLRYLDLLKQAKNMEEILQVQNEINDIQENMEAAAGRVSYLTHSAAFSTIQLGYFQVLNPQARDQETPPGFGQKVLTALTAGLGWVGELIILLVSLWPVWLGLLTAWWIYRKYRPAKRVPVNSVAPPAHPEV
ncbi:DUF4349 domain-containing protein [Paraflavitalea soli]|uniref:DUF4349 domain-containing protein n=1 Tax=Paraflavitalea soli TaxID=2315862 RepID=A0A3B7MNG1_9BACT|nr:DUF4349 domain-containing protein [Paraflavitalea soli]AXY73155.1 DUF4349 domain-containing protein [Paraflavitalea soli]